MRNHRSIALLPVMIMAASCAGQPGPLAAPFRTAFDTSVRAHEGETLVASAEEMEAAQSPQPALHAMQTSRFFAALAKRHPEVSGPIRELEKRSLALTKLQLRAAHALAFEDMKTLTLAETAALLERWMVEPTELLAYSKSTLDRVAGLDRQQTLRIARKLPAVSVALEALGRDVPTEPAQVAGIHLRHRLIRDFIGLMKIRQPDRAAELDDLQQRLIALSPDEMRALHAIAWEEDKDKTLAQAVERMTALIQEPGAYVKHLQGHLVQLQGLSAQGQAQLVSSYPAVLGQIEDILYGQGPGAAQGQTELQ